MGTPRRHVQLGSLVQQGAIMKIIYGILAIFLIAGAIEGFRLNLVQIADGGRLPKEPAQRQGFIVGMFVVPTFVLAAGVGCGYLAVRGKRKSHDDDRPTQS